MLWSDWVGRHTIFGESDNRNGAEKHGVRDVGQLVHFWKFEINRAFSLRVAGWYAEGVVFGSLPIVELQSIMRMRGSDSEGSGGRVHCCRCEGE